VDEEGREIWDIVRICRNPFGNRELNKPDVVTPAGVKQAHPLQMNL